LNLSGPIATDQPAVTNSSVVVPVESLQVENGVLETSSQGQNVLDGSRAFSTNWTAAGIFSVYWPTQGRRRNVTGESTFLLDRQLTRPWDAFVEYAGDFPENPGPRHLLHFGTALEIREKQQIDFHVGVRPSSAAVDHFIGIGYSFRFSGDPSIGPSTYNNRSVCAT
jgi:hypothetical protein